MNTAARSRMISRQTMRPWRPRPETPDLLDGLAGAHLFSNTAAHQGLTSNTDLLSFTAARTIVPSKFRLRPSRLRRLAGAHPFTNMAAYLCVTSRTNLLPNTAAKNGVFSTHDLRPSRPRPQHHDIQWDIARAHITAAHFPLTSTSFMRPSRPRPSRRDIPSTPARAPLFLPGRTCQRRLRRLEQSSWVLTETTCATVATARERAGLIRAHNPAAPPTNITTGELS
jgi:hypothetical protein